MPDFHVDLAQTPHVFHAEIPHANSIPIFLMEIHAIVWGEKIGDMLLIDVIDVVYI